MISRSFIFMQTYEIKYCLEYKDNKQKRLLKSITKRVSSDHSKNIFYSVSLI